MLYAATAPRRTERRPLALGDRLRLWCGRVIDMADEIKNLAVLASLGSRSAAARLQAIENDDGQPGVVRDAAQKARHHARHVAYFHNLLKDPEG